MSVLLDSVLPVLGVILSIVLFLSTYPAIRSIQKNKRLDSFNPLPFPFLLTNCVGWVAYGTVTHDIIVFAPNAFGFLTSLYFILVCFEFSDERGRMILRRIVMGLLSYMAIIALITLFALSDSSDRQLLVGFGTNAVLFCFYGAPLSTMKTVIRMKSAATISAPLCMAALVNCFVWIVYGIGLVDPFIYVPNGVGFTLNIAQLILILRYDGVHRFISSCSRRTTENISLSMVSTIDLDDHKKLELEDSPPSSGRSSLELNQETSGDNKSNSNQHNSDALHQETTTEVRVDF